MSISPSPWTMTGSPTRSGNSACSSPSCKFRRRISMERSPTILYVDDDEALVRLIQRGLSRRGYGVEGATTIEDGLARLAKGDIDVVALDHFSRHRHGNGISGGDGDDAVSAAGRLCNRGGRHHGGGRSAQGRRRRLRP